MKNTNSSRTTEEFTKLERDLDIERVQKSVDRTLSDVQKSYRGSNKKKKKKRKKKLEKKFKKRFRKGFKKGFKMGEIHKAEEVARILLIRGFSLEIICKATGLAKEAVDELNIIE